MSLTGEYIDWKRIGEGDENYFVNNKEALDAAIAAADKFVTLVGSSDNPFMARLQGKDAKGLESLWVNFNSFTCCYLGLECHDRKLMQRGGSIEKDGSLARGYF